MATISTSLKTGTARLSSNFIPMDNPRSINLVQLQLTFNGGATYQTSDVGRMIRFRNTSTNEIFICEITKLLNTGGGNNEIVINVGNEITPYIYGTDTRLKRGNFLDGTWEFAIGRDLREVAVTNPSDFTISSDQQHISMTNKSGKSLIINSGAFVYALGVSVTLRTDQIEIGDNSSLSFGSYISNGDNQPLTPRLPCRIRDLHNTHTGDAFRSRTNNNTIGGLTIFGGTWQGVGAFWRLYRETGTDTNIEGLRAYGVHFQGRVSARVAGSKSYLSVTVVNNSGNLSFDLKNSVNYSQFTVTDSRQGSYLWSKVSAGGLTVLDSLTGTQYLGRRNLASGTVFDPISNIIVERSEIQKLQGNANREIIDLSGSFSGSSSNVRENLLTRFNPTFNSANGSPIGLDVHMTITDVFRANVPVSTIIANVGRTTFIIEDGVWNPVLHQSTLRYADRDYTFQSAQSHALTYANFFERGPHRIRLGVWGHQIQDTILDSFSHLESLIFTFVEDTNITESNQETVRGYRMLENSNKLYDYLKYYELTNTDTKHNFRKVGNEVEIGGANQFGLPAGINLTVDKDSVAGIITQPFRVNRIKGTFDLQIDADPVGLSLIGLTQARLDAINIGEVINVHIVYGHNGEVVNRTFKVVGKESRRQVRAVQVQARNSDLNVEQRLLTQTSGTVISYEIIRAVVNLTDSFDGSIKMLDNGLLSFADGTSNQTITGGYTDLDVNLNVTFIGLETVKHIRLKVYDTIASAENDVDATSDTGVLFDFALPSTNVAVSSLVHATQSVTGGEQYAKLYVNEDSDVDWELIIFQTFSIDPNNSAFSDSIQLEGDNKLLTDIRNQTSQLPEQIERTKADIILAVSDSNT